MWFGGEKMLLKTKEEKKLPTGVGICPQCGGLYAGDWKAKMSEIDQSKRCRCGKPHLQTQ